MRTDARNENMSLAGVNVVGVVWGAGCRVDQAPASADSQETLPSSSQCLAQWSVPGWGLLLHTVEQVDIRMLGYLHYHPSHSENTDIFGRLDKLYIRI